MARRPQNAPGPGRSPVPAARGLGGRLRSRAGRRAVLAVWLSLLVVGSLVFVPGVGAAPPGGEPPGLDKGSGDKEPRGQNKSKSNNGNGNAGTTNGSSKPGQGKAVGKTNPAGLTNGSSAGEDTQPTDGTDGTTTTVTERGVEAGDTVSMDVSSETTGSDDVSVDAVSGTAQDSGDATVSVVTYDDTPTHLTSFATDDGVETLGRFRLEAGIGDGTLEDVSVTFEVSKQRLDVAGADVESVTLYGYFDGEWTALETEAVGETATHYVFTADSPYLSEFAVGALRPIYELWSTSVDDRTVAVGEEVVVTTRFTNIGSADGVFVADLVVDSRTVERQQLTVAGGGTRQATFRWTPERPGTYEVVVNDVSVGTVTVTPADEPVGRTTLLGGLTRWMTDPSPASVLTWAYERGRYAIIGLAPSFVGILLG